MSTEAPESKELVVQSDAEIAPERKELVVQSDVKIAIDNYAGACKHKKAQEANSIEEAVAHCNMYKSYIIMHIVQLEVLKNYVEKARRDTNNNTLSIVGLDYISEKIVSSSSDASRIKPEELLFAFTKRHNNLRVSRPLEPGEVSIEDGRFYAYLNGEMTTYQTLAILSRNPDSIKHDNLYKFQIETYFRYRNATYEARQIAEDKEKCLIIVEQNMEIFNKQCVLHKKLVADAFAKFDRKRNPQSRDDTTLFMCRASGDTEMTKIAAMKALHDSIIPVTVAIIYATAAWIIATATSEMASTIYEMYKNEQKTL